MNINLYKRISIPKGVRLAILGDCHEHSEAFLRACDGLLDGQTWLVSLGDVYDKGYGQEFGDLITNKLIKLNESGIGFAVRGNHELKKIRANKTNLSSELSWWNSQPVCISFDFWNGAKITVVHAGFVPGLKDLNDINLDVCYVREVDEDGKHIPMIWKTENDRKKLVKAKDNGIDWHKLYDGRFGYVVAGHASQVDGIPKFYNYSANIDTEAFNTGLLTAFVTDFDGNRDKIEQFKCIPKGWTE